jgi:hypothetical protein
MKLRDANGNEVKIGCPKATEGSKREFFMETLKFMAEYADDHWAAEFAATKAVAHCLLEEMVWAGAICTSNIETYLVRTKLFEPVFARN